jgi:hypothetical protein
MCNLIANILVAFKTLEDKFHKLTSRGINSLRFLIECVINRLYCLPHYELKSNIHQNIKIP